MRRDATELVAVDDESVYFADMLDGTFEKVAISGGAVVALASGPKRRDQSPAKLVDLTLDAEHVYWATQSHIQVLRVATPVARSRDARGEAT